ncbi:12553_t:CDS:2, partial [Dentiscutata erythropus]
LYDENDQLSNLVFLQHSIVTNLVGAFDILQNNTLLVAQNEPANAWSFPSIDLPQFSPYNDNSATPSQEQLNNSGKDKIFAKLINELVIIIPTEQERLYSNKLYQVDNSLSGVEQYLISFAILEMRDGDKKNSTVITDDLNLLIQ